jgi:hypothetical protein
VAALAMLIQVVVVGLVSLLKLSLSSPPGTELVLLVLKGAVAVSWLAFTVAGLVAWTRREWLVIAAPIGTLAVLLLVDWIGTNAIHWYLSSGY